MTYPIVGNWKWPINDAMVGMKTELWFISSLWLVLQIDWREDLTQIIHLYLNVSLMLGANWRWCDLLKDRKKAKGLTDIAWTPEVLNSLNIWWESSLGCWHEDDWQCNEYWLSREGKPRL